MFFSFWHVFAAKHDCDAKKVRMRESSRKDGERTRRKTNQVTRHEKKGKRRVMDGNQSVCCYDADRGQEAVAGGQFWYMIMLHHSLFSHSR